jgi:molybdopterin converting factor subunit 1
MTSVRVRILFFGLIRDVVGRREDSLDIPDGSRLESVFEHYASRFPKLREMAASTVLAVNQQFSTPAAPLADGDEVAFLPPVSGGSGLEPSGDAKPGDLTHYAHRIDVPAGHFFALTRHPIDGTAIAHQLLRGEDGAFVNFEGVARNNTKGRATRYLEYECYEAMAVKMMAQIGLDIAKNYDIGRIAMVHRLGHIGISETSVAVVVTAPHRKPAFDAALEGINRLKKVVPVWKKEYFVDGEVWVDGEWDDSLITAQTFPSAKAKE